jgi:hypothetical protein
MNFDLSTINTEFSGLIGFDQRVDESYPAYDSDLILSSSGLKIDDHSLFTIENIFNCAAPNFGDMTLTDTQEEEFNNWVRNKINYSQVRLINKLFANKKGLGQGKELLQDVRLFDNTRDMTKVATNVGAFVGIELCFEKMDGLALHINRIGTHFDSVVDVPIYILNSGQISPIETPVTINHLTANSYQWTPFNKKIFYNSSTFLSGSRYYIGYFQDDLGSAKAIRQNIDFDNICYGCSNWNRIWHEKYSRYMSANNIKVSSSKLNGNDYWEKPESAVSTTDNFGINLDFSVVSDLTQFFVKNKNVLAYALKMQVQVDILQDMLNSNRDTWLGDDIRRNVEIEMSTENKGGIMSEYLDSFKALDFDYSGLGTYTLPSNRRGIKRRYV